MRRMGQGSIIRRNTLNSYSALRWLNTKECEQFKKTFFGYDIYQFYIEFQDWLERTGGETPKNPAAAFTNWLKSYYKITGPLQR